MRKRLIIALNVLLNVSLVFLLFSSQVETIRGKIIKAEIYYMNFMAETPIAVDSCYKVFRYMPKDSLITDSRTLTRLNDLINNLKIKHKKTNYNFRIACLLIMENGDSNQLCLNIMGGIRYNKTNMKDSEELFYFFNNLLYSDSLSRHFWNKPK